MNLFRGFADSARMAEARYAEVRAQSEREGLDRAIEVEIRAAVARLDAARARERVGQAALMQARESQRIVRDRYDGGLATIGDVLRAAGAVLDAESRRPPRRWTSSSRRSRSTALWGGCESDACDVATNDAKF